MSPQAPRHEMTTRPVVLRIPGMDAVTVLRDIAFPAADGGAAALDLYRPADAPGGARVPVVVIVAGYPDPGFEAILGCKFKAMESSVSWATLLAASGIAAIAYANRDPAPDLRALLAHVRANAALLGIDESRIGLLASSGNVALALGALLEQPLRCAALLYGYTLDHDGSTAVADAAKTFGFASPCAGRSVGELPRDVPLFVARAGRDAMPGLNAALDAFVARAIAANLPLTLANHASGPHAFDLVDDSEASREIVRQTLAFLRFHLRA